MTAAVQYPCDRFAAFLAHCLNSEDFSSIDVDEGSLYALLTDALATRYAEPMLHHPGYAWRMAPEEAAARYFEISVQRRLQLSPRVQTSIAQRFLAALCRRGVEPLWGDATVARELGPSAKEPVPRVIPTAVQKEFARCGQALAKIKDQISPGSPSPTIRARFGPVVLRLYTLNAPVPEEVSLWDALACAPHTLKSLPRGQPFNEFCCLVIDGIRTAHRAYQELVGLGRGLCPFDWIDTLSIQQARALRKFLRILEENAGVDSQPAWERAWEEVQVAGFRSAAQLWNSEIGMALRLPQSRTRVDYTPLENLPDPESSGTEEALLQADSFERALATLLSAGILSPLEGMILTSLYSGATKAEILLLAGVAEHLEASGLTYEKLLESLEQRVVQWANSRQERKE